MKVHVSLYGVVGEERELTTDLIKDMLDRENYKVHLIKAYRECSCLGLKDSKDACDNAGYQYDNMIALFRPYLNLHEYHRKQQEKEKLRGTIIQGVECAINNYEWLGFDNVYDAIRQVLNNLENQNQ